LILTRPNKIITRQQNGSPWRCRQVHNLWNSVHDKEESFNYCLLNQKIVDTKVQL